MTLIITSLLFVAAILKSSDQRLTRKGNVHICSSLLGSKRKTSEWRVLRNVCVRLYSTFLAPAVWSCNVLIPKPDYRLNLFHRSRKFFQYKKRAIDLYLFYFIHFLKQHKNMKKLLMLALLCLSFVASKAAPVSIINNTGCTIIVTPFCYDQKCNILPCSPGIVVPPGGTIPLPSCSCPLPLLQGYQVCWQDCPGLCVTVAPPGSACFPPQANLAPCPPCPNAPVFFDGAGNLII